MLVCQEPASLHLLPISDQLPTACQGGLLLNTQLYSSMGVLASSSARCLSDFNVLGRGWCQTQRAPRNESTFSWRGSWETVIWTLTQAILACPGHLPVQCQPFSPGALSLVTHGQAYARSPLLRKPLLRPIRFHPSLSSSMSPRHRPTFLPTRPRATVTIRVRRGDPSYP